MTTSSNSATHNYAGMPESTSPLNTAEKLSKALAGIQGHSPQPVTDEFAKVIARELESRGIAKVSGLPSIKAESEWFDIAIELENRNKELEDEQEARRKAEKRRRTPRRTQPIFFAEPSKGH